jgi:hypothetical protein
VIAESQVEAESKIDEGQYKVRIVKCREIDLSGLPPLASGPIPRHWVVVIEDSTPELEAERPQQDNPEEECERQVRQMYLAMATDPELLSTGIREGFDCPSCEEKIWFELPAPRDRKKPDSGHRDCPKCGTHLSRNDNDGRWQVFVPPDKPGKICIFCGDRANSMEHVIPAWISKQLGIRETIEMEGSIQIGRQARRQPISFGSYRARIFCANCNTHFHHWEDEVIPLLVPMAKGIPMSLAPDSQAILARWAVKTAIALLSAEPGDQDMVPIAHREALRKKGRVIADTWVGFFRWHGSPVLITGQGATSGPTTSGPSLKGYVALLAFEGFGFHVTAYDKKLPPGKALGGDQPPLLSFLPTRTDMIHWPPPQTDNRMLPWLMNWTPLRSGSPLK